MRKSGKYPTPSRGKGDERVIKDKWIGARVSVEEYNEIKKNGKKYNMTISELLRIKGMEEKVVVIEDLKPFVIELKKIGNNVNQMTKLVHEKRISNVDIEMLERLGEEMKKVLLSLNSLTTKKRR